MRGYDKHLAKPSSRLSIILSIITLFVLSGCAPQLIDPGPLKWTPELHPTHFATRDGLSLPYQSWSAKDEKPKAILVALHGFNDYSAFFEDPATFMQAHGITSYAYDQRGFGGAGFRGRWFENARYRMDARDFTQLIAEKHPGIPLYILGESMGGAVAMTMLSEQDAPWVTGAILSAPAVWGRESMPWAQSALLWLSAHTMPSVTMSGRGLKIQPSDNIEMLIALGRDPLIIKGTRVDAINGLVDLMDDALAASRTFSARSLILYGGRDEIVKAGPTRMMFERLPKDAKDKHQIAIYPKAYHMLLRDLDAKTVWTDIIAWTDSPDTRLPSGADKRAEEYLSSSQ